MWRKLCYWFMPPPRPPVAYPKLPVPFRFGRYDSCGASTSGDPPGAGRHSVLAPDPPCVCRMPAWRCRAAPCSPPALAAIPLAAPLRLQRAMESVRAVPRTTRTVGVRNYVANNAKERSLTQAEAKALIESVQLSENKSLKFIVAMLILTGARKGEVLQSQWDQFNLEQRSWRIPITKSGKARHVPINDGLLQLLNAIPRHRSSNYLFVNPETNRPFGTFFNSWNQARKRAGLPDVRVHGLRHTQLRKLSD